MAAAEISSFSCDAYLDASGVMRGAHIRRENGGWVEFDIDQTSAVRPQNGYVVPTLPVEFHCHGSGRSDFSDFRSLDLSAINQEARREGALYIASVSLPRHNLGEFVDFMREYAHKRQDGELSHIIAVSLEGPLLASVGGTPESGTWAPTKEEWAKLAECGELGLSYAVLSPDACLPRSRLAEQMGAAHPSLEWIIDMLVSRGVRPALGHFQRSDPAASARCIETVLQVAAKHGNPLFSGTILTDHVFNDMPLKFRHAWRTPEERRRRDAEINDLHLDHWTLDNLDEMLGEVPAALVRAAHAGLLTLCINFDGSHVDLQVCRRILELVGSKSIIAITDSTDTTVLGGQRLHRREGIDLWYQESGIVAAGMSSLDSQMSNMRSIGLDEESIWDLVSFVPSRVLNIKQHYNVDAFPTCCYVADNGQRYAIQGVAT